MITEELKKKKKHKINYKSILKYVGLYLACTLIFTVGMVLLKYPASAKTNGNTSLNQSAVDIIGEEDTTAFGKLMSGAMAIQTAEFELDAEISGNINLSVIANGVVSLESGYSNVKVKSDLVIDYDGNIYEMKVAFINNYVYFTVNENYYKISVESIGEAVEVVLNELGVDLSTSMDMSSVLDINTIYSLSDNLTEENFDDKNILTLEPIANLPIQITTDLDYNIKNVSIKELEYDNLHFNIDLNIDTKVQNIVVAVNESSYKDLSEVSSFTNNVINTIKQQSFNGTITLNYKDVELNMDYIFDKQSKAIKINIIYNNVPVEIIYKNQTVYLQIMGVKIKATITQLQELLEICMQKFGLQLPAIDMSDSAIADIVLEQIGNFEDISFEDRLIIINTKYGDLTITSNDSRIQTVSFAGSEEFELNFEASINSSSLSNEIETDGNYVDYSSIKSLIENCKKYVEERKIFLDIDLTIKGYRFTGYIGLVDEKLEAKLNTSILNQDIQFVVKNNNIYISMLGLNICAEFEDYVLINNLLKENFDIDIFDYLPVESLDFDLNSVDNNLIDANKVIEIIKNLSVSIENGILDIEYGEYDISADLTNSQINSIRLSSDLVNCGILVGEEKETTAPNKYITFKQLYPIIDVVLKSLKNLAVSGQIDVEMELFGETNVLNLDYAFKYENNDICGYLETEFKGLDINIYIIEKVIYVYMAELKIKIGFDEIAEFSEWIDSNFDTNLNLEELLSKKLSDFDLSSFNENIVFNSDNAKVTLTNGLTIELNYTDLIDSIYFENDWANANIYCTNFDLMELQSVNISEYQSYKIITDTFEILREKYSQNGFDISANALVYNDGAISYDVDIDLKLSNSDGFIASGNANVTGLVDAVANAYYYNDHLFADYNGLKLSISKDSVKQIMDIALSVMGIDVGTSDLFGAINSDLTMDTQALRDLLPKIDFGNPLNILSMFKSCVYTTDLYTLTLDGTYINEKANKDIVIKFYIANKDLSKIEMLNFYSGVGDTEYFDLSIEFNQFNGVDLPIVEDYIDISTSAELINAFIHSSNLTDFQISSNISISFLGISMDIPLNVKVKLIDKKPVIYINLPNIPVIAEVNNDTFEFGDSSRDRALNIYIKDGFVYFHRIENIKVAFFGSRYLEKKLKISMDTLLSNPLYYLMEYGMGFSSSIMSKIYSSFVIRENINLGAVLDNYSYNENGNYYSVTIDLQEIIDNEDIRTATFNIYLTKDNVNSTENKTYNYLSKLTFDVEMKLSILTMRISSSDTTLDSIGESISQNVLDSILNFVNSYIYAVNEKWIYKKDKWQIET